MKMPNEVSCKNAVRGNDNAAGGDVCEWTEDDAECDAAESMCQGNANADGVCGGTCHREGFRCEPVFDHLKRKNVPCKCTKLKKGVKNPREGHKPRKP